MSSAAPPPNYSSSRDHTCLLCLLTEHGEGVTNRNMGDPKAVILDSSLNVVDGVSIAAEIELSFTQYFHTLNTLA